jgi:lysophospholipase L1-like esterase
MKQLLEQAKAGAQWTIINEAHGGEYIGPKEGSPTGVSEPLFTSETTGRYFEIVKHDPQADVIFANYAANDSKVYSPAVFRNKLEALGRQLKKDFPEAMLIFSTSMYCDPKHAAPYHIDHFQVPGFKAGSLRNDYLEPYNRQIREFTRAHGYRLADIFRRIAEETERGNWDLRIRADDGDPTEDLNHEGDMAWFDNIHPNFKSTEIIARLYVETLTKLH